MDKSLLSIEEIKQPDIQVEDIKKGKTKKEHTGGKRIRFILSFLIYLVIVPIIIFLGIKLYNGRKYNIISMMIAILACVPFFITFEKGKTKARELVVIAVMTAISVLGRIIFSPIPGFKPVTAIVIITAIAYGAQAGFLTGALSALVSNIFFGQGPWTPFQMFAWGFLGLLAGIIFVNKKKPNIVLLIIIGIIGGVLFSFIMDIWSVLNMDGGWNWSRYWAKLISGISFTVIYAVSNVFFLLILTKPFLEKLNRIKTKYDLFSHL